MRYRGFGAHQEGKMIGRTDRVWTGWEGLRVWRELVPVFQDEAVDFVDRGTTFGGYVLARRYLQHSGGLTPLHLVDPKRA
jgi:hypothetical protein